MVRLLLKTALTLVLVIVFVAVGTYVLGYWQADRHADLRVDETRMRQTGAEIAQGARAAGTRVAEAVEDGALTAKIKSKMALDDQVKARDIDVDASGGLVTLSGVLRSEAERERAVQLARETDGVQTVIDALVVPGTL